MGARVAHMFRNFNLESRAHREISREKPLAAPRHPTGPPAAARGPPAAETVDSLSQKNDPLLNLLKAVYVESNDPAAAEATKEVMESKETHRRPVKFSVPGDLYGMGELTDVPKGKLTVVEALRALNSHHRQPQTWTPEKIAQDYSLELKDTKALLEFFFPFQIQVIPPKNAKAKQIGDS